MKTSFDNIQRKCKIGKRCKNRTYQKKRRKRKRTKSYRNKHPWDIAQEIITEQNQAALAIKWSVYLMKLYI